MLSLCIAAAANNAMGKGGRLPWRIPEDLRHFKRLTMGKPVIMGRKTFESLPVQPSGLAPLPGRENIVLTRNISLLREQNPSISVHFEDNLKNILEQYADSPEEAFIIGGARIMRQTLAYCATLYITRILKDVEGDVFMPEIDKNEFELTEKQSFPQNDPPFEFQTWRRRLRLVIFDMDGLMFDTEPTSYENWKIIFKKHGLEFTDEFYNTLVGTNRESCKGKFDRYYGPGVFEPLYEEHGQIMRARYANTAPDKKPGLDEILAFLRQYGIKRAVATSTERDMTENHLRLAGLDSAFNGLLCGDQVIHGKPDPEIFLKTAQMFGCPPANSLVLEDSKMGLLAAKAAGIPCILIPDIVRADNESKATAFRVLPDLYAARDAIAAEYLTPNGEN